MNYFHEPHRWSIIFQSLWGKTSQEKSSFEIFVSYTVSSRDLEVANEIARFLGCCSLEDFSREVVSVIVQYHVIANSH